MSPQKCKTPADLHQAGAYFVKSRSTSEGSGK
jgi:hypothetical protein